MTAINVRRMCVCVWVLKRQSKPGCSLAFSWQAAVIALVPARLPRNWHLGNENARCWRGHLIVLGRSEWERASEWEGPEWGKGGSGDAETEDGPPGEQKRAAGEPPSPEDGFDPSASKLHFWRMYRRGGGESWVWGKRAKARGLVAVPTMVGLSRQRQLAILKKTWGSRCLQSEFSFLLLLFLQL